MIKTRDPLDDFFDQEAPMPVDSDAFGENMWENDRCNVFVKDPATPGSVKGEVIGSGKAWRRRAESVEWKRILWRRSVGAGVAQTENMLLAEDDVRRASPKDCPSTGSSSILNDEPRHYRAHAD